MGERVALPRALGGDTFFDDGSDTLTLLNNAYWLLREIEGTWRNPNSIPMSEAMQKIGPLLDELDKQRWPNVV